MKPLQQNPGIGDYIADDLRLKIVSGEWSDNEKLSENIIAQQYGVSRAPVREAIKLLSYEGLVSTTKQGMVVHGFSEEDLYKLYEVRYMLEWFCFAHLPQSAVGKVVEQLDMVVDKMELALAHQDFQEFSLQDVQFHNSIFEAVDHKYIRLLWENIKGLCQTTLYVGTKKRFEQGDYEFKREVVAQHRNIVDGLRRGDRKQVEVLLKEHFKHNCWIEMNQI